MKKSDLITEGIREKMKPEPFDHNKKVKPKRSKCIKWLLGIIDNIVTALT